MFAHAEIIVNWKSLKVTAVGNMSLFI